MTPEPAQRRTTRHTRARFDRPDLRPGNQAWWRGALYAIERVELHGGAWVAVVVRASDRDRPDARCWFAATHELSVES